MYGGSRLGSPILVLDHERAGRKTVAFQTGKADERSEANGTSAQHQAQDRIGTFWRAPGFLDTEWIVLGVTPPRRALHPEEILLEGPWKVLLSPARALQACTISWRDSASLTSCLLAAYSPAAQRSQRPRSASVEVGFWADFAPLSSPGEPARQELRTNRLNSLYLGRCAV